MNKHTATDANGTVHTRNSENRTYSHVILVRRKVEGDKLGALTWCGRPDLAQKEYAKALKGGYWAEVVMLEATVTVTGKKVTA
jgi:hypothetical protein